MTFIALIIGAVVVIAALRNSQAALGAALMEDVPAYIIWAAAIFAIGAIGWIPNMRPISRMLMALVLVVLVLRNYSAIISGFEDAWQDSPAPSSGTSGASISGSGGLLGGSGGFNFGGADSELSDAVGGSSSGFSTGDISTIASVASEFG